MGMVWPGALRWDITGNGKMDFLVYPKDPMNRFWMFTDIQSGGNNDPYEVYTGTMETIFSTRLRETDFRCSTYLANFSSEILDPRAFRQLGSTHNSLLFRIRVIRSVFCSTLIPN